VQRPAVLVIAATDSSGGAGLTRDVRVLTDFAVDALCVVTAVTAQSDKEVSAVHHVPPEIIRAQIASAFATRQIGAIKIGMLGTQATVEAVVAGLSAASGWSAHGSSLEEAPYHEAPLGEGRSRGSLLEASLAHGIPIVVDPVLVSSSGGVLLDAGGRAALTGSLFPLATLVTPNVPEVAALLGEPVAADEAGLIQQGEKLLRFGSQAILLKGGHPYASGRYSGRNDGEDAVDLLISNDAAGSRPASGSPARGHLASELSIERIHSKRIAGSSRGTGCALASGIAAGLAAGKPLSVACHAAKRYVLGMLAP
jgi:hydroxymethylpyrimidine/phosphomethylpyrimidine kinase